MLYVRGAAFDRRLHAAPGYFTRRGGSCSPTEASGCRGERHTRRGRSQVSLPPGRRPGNWSIVSPLSPRFGEINQSPGRWLSSGQISRRHRDLLIALWKRSISDDFNEARFGARFASFAPVHVVAAACSRHRWCRGLEASRARIGPHTTPVARCTQSSRPPESGKSSSGTDGETRTRTGDTTIFRQPCAHSESAEVACMHTGLGGSCASWAKSANCMDLSGDAGHKRAPVAQSVQGSKNARRV
jgi:hypothetical protein